MYRLSQPLSQVIGIGPSLAKKFELVNIYTIKDLLLYVPLRYEDRSSQKKIKDLIKNELVTIQAEVKSVSNQYRGRRSIQRATVQDNSGNLKLIWFNSPYIKDTLQKGQSFFFSGKLNDRGMMAQPKVEKISGDTVHTNRLVPLYSLIPEIKQGNVRRFLKNIVDHLEEFDDPLSEETSLLNLNETFKHLHFPDDQELTIKARERLAIEELLGLMKHSLKIKERWQDNHGAHRVEVEEKKQIPDNLPFELTSAQLRATQEILTDINSDVPMNRLLLGDVGSGKTVVAGIAALHTINQGLSTALIAPTQILAEQHAATLKELFPDLEIELITAKTKTEINDRPKLYVGTHAVINRLAEINPALIIYDEQHRFGVSQRSGAEKLSFDPHLLTMSATPIPRSLMLTIFSHLEMSLLDEMPPGRLPVKTWVTPEKKRQDSYDWLHEQIKDKGQALIVCPFINPSKEEAFSQVAAVTELHPQIKKAFPEYKVDILHGQLKQTEKDKISKQLYAQEIQILVTTPIIEVGVDLPNADVMMIESAERFGLASLHQLRGRVGRAGQQAYCLLFTQSKNPETLKRLKKFTEINDGIKLAEFDLQNRGAGDLFGTEQHGFDQLKFAQWTNLELITQAQQIFQKIKDNSDWEPLLKINYSAHINPN